MTEAEAATEAFIRYQEENPDYWGDQDENGVDLARLRENLKLTQAERLANLDRSRYLIRMFEDARDRKPEPVR